MSTVFNTDIIVPLVIILITGFALYSKTDVFSAFVKGAKEGMQTAAEILPSLCFLMTAIAMLRESGALEMLISFISPFTEKTGFPTEVLPLAILRPFSGSGALGYYEELCQNLEQGSFAERVASVLMGGSETTFYTVAVYYGAIGIKKGRNTVPAALTADIAAAILSVSAVNFFFKQ